MMWAYKFQDIGHVPARAIARKKELYMVAHACNQPFSLKISSKEVAVVTMATHDKHCQTYAPDVNSVKSDFYDASGYSAMYDETVPVVNAREIESPSSSSDEEVVRATMNKFTPPVRHTARHDFDSESESESEAEKFLNDSAAEESPERKIEDRMTQQRTDKSVEVQRPVLNLGKSETTRPAASSSRVSKTPLKRDESSNSETDSGDIEAELTGAGAGSGRKRGPATSGVVIPAEGAYDPKHFQDLKVPPEMENIFQYIMKYTPQKIDIEFKLQPFVPDYVPGVGDADAFLKVGTPAQDPRGAALDERVHEHIDNLGLTVLDEPSAEQSDSALLHLQLRAISKTNSAKSTVLTKKIDHAEKNGKAIERWIKDVSELHLSKPAPTVSYTTKMPDIDTLMEEWPESMEEKLNSVGFPPASLDCSLSDYAALLCGLFDIPTCGDTPADRIQALHVLFSLYSAVRGSQLYAERLREAESVAE